MNTNFSRVWFSFAFSIVAVSAAAQDQTAAGKSGLRIVGYLPDYRIEQIDASVGRYLTDVVFFSVLPEPRGQFVSSTLQSPKTNAVLKRLRDEFHVRIHLCVGGWDRSQGFADIAATPASRKLFADGLTAYCLQHQFAGADLDWEHPQNETESKNYGLLLAEVSQAFKPRGLELTAAMASWQTLTPAGIQAVDAIHLMSYDAEGRHSTLEQAQSDVRKFLGAGVPSGKLRLGLPFYGRGVTERNLTKTYAEIVSQGISKETDEVNGLYFNGTKTILAKTRFAKDQKLGGVMVWEIGQDAVGDKSLLKVIHSEVTRKTP